MIQFPDHFLFGAATSAHQVEGNNVHSDWWAWEQRQLKNKNEKGKIMEVSGDSCDQWNRFREDFHLAKELGHNAHRFSLEWARIEPEEGRYDGFALSHYEEVLGALEGLGITPLVTLHHFTNPVWFSEKGGWERRDAADCFARYVERTMQRLGSQVRFWMPINEPWVLVSNGWLQKEWPPEKRNPVLAWRAWHNLLAAHKKAYEIIKRYAPHSFVGFNVAYAAFRPHSLHNPMDRFGASVARYQDSIAMLNRAQYAMDFIGVNYYRGFSVSVIPPFVHELGDAKSDLGWGIYPEGLLQAIRELRRFRKPIFITENGLADADDSRRSAFLVAHLAKILTALDEGIDVLGYLHWSLLDNFEWARGFSPRFGLVAVDYATQKRTPRPSAYLYRDIIRSRRLPS